MLLAMACGACFYQESDSVHVQSEAKKWIFAAQSWLSATPFEKKRLNISGLQIHCLILLAREVHGIAGDLIWIPTGNLIRTAFTMGIHHDPKHFPEMTVLQAELRRRLWATILELNFQFSLDAGMNPLLSMNDFDTEPPANINDEDIDETTRDPPLSKSSDTFTQTAIQILLLKSLSTRLRVVRLVNDFRCEPSYDEVLELGAEVTKACKASRHTVQNWAGQNPVTGLTQLQRNLVDMAVRRFLLTIHHLFATKAQDDPRYYFSRKVCLDCVTTMMTYPSNESGTAAGRLTDTPQDDFTRLRVSGGGYFKSVMLHCAMILLLELLQQVDEDLPHTEHSRCTRESLKEILRGIIELAAARISIAENNVKGHIFLSSVLGQVEAMEAGRSLNVGAFEGARKSVILCCELLAARAPSVQTGSDVQPRLVASDWRQGDALVEEQENGMGFGMVDWNADFEVPDSWLFAGWEENKCW